VLSSVVRRELPSHAVCLSPQVDKELAVRMYRRDGSSCRPWTQCSTEAQRQGRFSFYLATSGEEAINIASAAALQNEDHVFAQVRFIRFL